MRKNWDVKSLGDVCEVINRGVSPKYVESDGLLVLNQKCIRDHVINYELARFHDEEAKKVATEKIIQLGDVLINSTGTGTLGRVAQVREAPVRATVDSHVTIMRPIANHFYDEFFGYALISIEEEITLRGEGCGGQTELARSTLKNDFKISYPKSLSEQQRIVSILDEAFAAIAKAKANAETNLQNARELFESYLQSVFANPGEGWEEVRLSELAIDITDGDHMPPPKSESGVPFITISNINKATNTIDFSDTFMVSPEYYKNLKANRKPKRGDVLYTVTGSFGIPVIVEADVEFCFQRHIGLIRPKTHVNSKWLYYLILSPQVFKQGNEGATGTAQRTVSLSVLRNFTVPKVPIEEQQSIVAKLDALSAETQKLEAIYRQKLTDLDELRKAILQKAFQGELTSTAATTLAL